jgi:hypothetical protein
MVGRHILVSHLKYTLIDAPSVGYRSLYDVAGIPHGEFSLDNMMCRKDTDGKVHGILIDLDLPSPDESASQRGIRTSATMPFTSWVMNRLPVYTATTSSPSSTYVIVWITCRYDGGWKRDSGTAIVGMGDPWPEQNSTARNKVVIPMLSVPPADIPVCCFPYLGLMRIPTLTRRRLAASFPLTHSVHGDQVE